METSRPVRRDSEVDERQNPPSLAALFGQPGGAASLCPGRFQGPGQADHRSRALRQLPGHRHRRVQDRAAPTQTSPGGRTTTSTPSPRSPRTAASPLSPTTSGTPGRTRTPMSPTSGSACKASRWTTPRALWVLDTGNPGMNGTLPGAPKLVKFNLATKKATQTIPFGADICPAKSYLNDVRIDTTRNGRLPHRKRRRFDHRGRSQVGQGPAVCSSRTSPPSWTRTWT